MREKNARAALVQEPPVFLNLRETMLKAEEIADECAEQGSGIIVFPETWLCGYPVWLDEAPDVALWDHPPAKRLFGYLARNSVEIPGPEIETLKRVAKKTGAYIVIGLHEREGGTLYNTSVFFEPDGEYIKHRKLTPTYTERLVWGVGDGSTLGTLETPYGVLGGLICWEHWLPHARAAMHARREAIHTAQFPTVHERHQIASRHYAFEGQCFVLASGTVLSKGDVLEGFESLGADDPEVFSLLESMRAEQLQRGGSAVIAPDISYVKEPVYDDRGTVYADLDLDLIDEGHLLLDTDGHYSRPDVFELIVDTAKRQNVSFGRRERDAAGE